MYYHLYYHYEYHFVLLVAATLFSTESNSIQIKNIVPQKVGIKVNERFYTVLPENYSADTPRMLDYKFSIEHSASEFMLPIYQGDWEQYGELCCIGCKIIHTPNTGEKDIMFQFTYGRDHVIQMKVFINGEEQGEEIIRDKYCEIDKGELAKRYPQYKEESTRVDDWKRQLLLRCKKLRHVHEKRARELMGLLRTATNDNRNQIENMLQELESTT